MIFGSTRISVRGTSNPIWIPLPAQFLSFKAPTTSMERFDRPTRFRSEFLGHRFGYFRTAVTPHIAINKI